MKLKTVIIIISTMLPNLLFSNVYNLQYLIEQAQENNIELRQSKLNVKISESEFISSKINYLPDISASVSRTESFETFLFEGSETNNALNFSISKSISLNDDTYFNTKLSKNSLKSSELNFKIQEQEILFEVINNYVSVLEAQKKLDLYDENIKIQENIVRESQQLFLQDKITSFEVQQSEINLLNARISALDAKNNLELSREKLFDLVNINDEGFPMEELKTELFDSEFVLNKDEILEIQLQNNEIDKHRINITRTKLDFFPQMSLQYNYRRNLSDSDYSYSNKSTDHTIGLNISYSLNKIFKNVQSNKQVQYLEMHKQLSYNQIETSIETKYEQYLKELNYYEQLNTLLSNKLNQTNQNLEIANQKYSLGLISRLDLDNAVYENLDAKINYEVNTYQIMLKRLSLYNLLSRVSQFVEKIK
ncbi:MAG: TolC family protein [Candidatus Cloacimonetes bacterium]|nr:TolC family protein [Candidatus Cloacimonadota bacterium]